MGGAFSSALVLVMRLAAISLVKNCMRLRGKVFGFILHKSLKEKRQEGTFTVCMRVLCLAGFKSIRQLSSRFSVGCGDLPDQLDYGIQAHRFYNIIFCSQRKCLLAVFQQI